MRYEECGICGKTIDSGHFTIHDDESISYACNDVDCDKKNCKEK